MKRQAGMAVLLAAIAFVCVVHAGEPRTAPADRAKVVAAARDIMEKARYCTLVTLGLDGQPQARIVDAFAPEHDMTVWIGTNPVTRKVAEVRKDPRATLLYFDTTRTSFVTLLGRAEVVTDAAARAKYWKDEWSEHYKDRNRGDDYVLVRFTPRRLEIVSPALGFVNDPKTWRPIAIDLR